jgi:hypothetical protein
MGGAMTMDDVLDRRRDLLGHQWREGKCSGCGQTMAEVRGILCPSEACDDDKRGVDLLAHDAQRDVLVDRAARDLVAALRTHAIPGNAAVALRALAEALGMP